MNASVNRQVLPGFGLSLGVTLGYLTLMVLIPLAACYVKAAELGFAEFLTAACSPRARGAYALTFGVSLASAAINVVLGLVVAWTLVRYEFPLKGLIDALVDVPLALPTAVAGLVYSILYLPHGVFGQFFSPLGIEVSNTRLGIVVVLVFTGFPFVVRMVQPVLEEMDAEIEEAASVLGANRWQTFTRVLFPQLLSPALAGFTLAFARSLGEYGSVVFIAGGYPETEIAPVLIVSRLEEFAYREAAAIAVVLLTVSFILLALINVLAWRSSRHEH
ncbi:MAG: sulfate ABC transporter permease subunit CysT [Planctomycetia bacterium]|nr:sulfate ABC transporter permease subunit CysT [Planctomycetia bacterium]